MNKHDTLVLRGIDEDIDFLMHHGVGGMNWYQHKFGNWERHAKYANGQPNPETTDNSGEKLFNEISKGSAIKVFGDISYQRYSTDSKYKEKWDKAADLGLNALKKMQPYNDFSDIDNDRDFYRQWFLFEDQTIGMPQIAYLMANDRKPSKQIKSLIKYVDDNADKFSRDGTYYNNRVALYIMEGNHHGVNQDGILYEFADQCGKILKK